MKASDYYQSDYINAEVLPVNKDVSMTIKMATDEHLPDGSSKPCIWFFETDKGLILNKTNLNTISGIHGDSMDEWKGKLISLFKTEVEYRGEPRWGVRVRLVAPEKPNVAPKPAAEATPEELIPF